MNSLEKLVEQGQQVQARQKLDRIDAMAAASGSALRTARLSSSRLGILATYSMYPMLGLFGAVPTALVLATRYPDEEVLLFVLAGLGAGVAIALTCVAIGELAGLRAFSQNLDWLLALPFPVEGYVDALARNDGCCFVVDFMGEAAPVQLVQDAAFGLGLANVGVSTEKGCLEIEVRTWRNYEGEVNYRLARLIRRIIDGLLVPIDERYAIRKVVCRKS